MQFKVYFREGGTLYIFTVEAYSRAEARRLGEYMACYECPYGRFYKVEKCKV